MLDMCTEIIHILIKKKRTHKDSRDSRVSIVTRLLPTCPTNRGSILGRAMDLSPLQRVQTGSGAHIASCSVGTRGIFPGLKAVGLLS